jgi:hypothetical protein
MVHVDVSEKCDRCKQPYTQKVEDGQVVHSRLRPYDELCKLVDPQLEQAKLAMLEKASSGFVTAQPDVPRYTAVRLPPDKTPPPPKAKVCPTCIQDYREKHQAFVKSWLREDDANDSGDPPGRPGVDRL